MTDQDTRSDTIISGAGVGRPEYQDMKSGNAPASRAADALDDLTADMTHAASRVRERIADAADPMADRAVGFAEAQKTEGARRIGEVAHAVNSAADALGKDHPVIADMARDAAARLDGLASRVQERSLGELVDDMNRIARENSFVVLGASALAGFALMRFLKSSGEATPRRSPDAPSRSAVQRPRTMDTTQDTSTLAPLAPV